MVAKAWSCVIIIDGDDSPSGIGVSWPVSDPERPVFGCILPC
jgi:hypothetical protein